MKNSYGNRNIYILVGAVVLGLAVFAGSSGRFKGAFVPAKTGQQLHVAGVTCRTFVPPVELAGGLAKNQLGYDSFIVANGVHPGFRDKTIVKGKEAINAWRFDGCDQGTKMSHLRFKLKGELTYLGNVEVYQDSTNVTRLLTNESKAKLQTIKDKFSGTYAEVSTEVEFITPLSVADGMTFSIVVEPTAYYPTSTLTAVVEEYTLVDAVGAKQTSKAPGNGTTLRGK